MCNCIRVLLNDFEDPAQCIHTIVKPTGPPAKVCVLVVTVLQQLSQC